MRVLLSSLLIALVSLVGAALTPASAGAALGVTTEKAQVAPAIVQPAHWRRHRWYRPYYYGYHYRPYRRHYYYRPYRYYGWYPGFYFRFGHRHRHRHW